MFRMSKFGDWTKAGAILQALNVHLVPSFKAQIREDGELFLKTVKDHIEAQDLPWTPLSPKTVELKGGDTTVYVETGFLRDNLEVRKVKAPTNGLTLFIGASPWKRHPSGMKLSELMIWLEYGTDSSPARPLIRPSWDEIEPLIKKNWKELLKDFIEKGGTKF